MNHSQTALTNSTYGLINADCVAELSQNDHISDWSSTTSLSLATIASLSRGYSLNHLMDQFTAWYARGDYTANRSAQMVDRTTIRSIEHYMINHDPFSSGSHATDDIDNGALLRIMPVVLYLNSQYGSDFISNGAAMLSLHQVTGLTHNQPTALITNSIYAFFVNQLLIDQQPVDAFETAIDATYDYYSKHQIFQEALSAFEQLNTPDFKNTSMSQLTASNDAVETLTACIWIVLNATSYHEALEMAQDIAGDATTLMPLVGTIAGLLFESNLDGLDQIQKYGRSMVKRIMTAGNRSYHFEQLSFN